MRGVTAVAALVAAAAAGGSVLSLAAAPLAAQTRCMYGTPGCWEVDQRAMSAAVTYQMEALTGLDGGVPDRTMGGVYLYYDIKLLSLLLRNLPIRTYDALHLDIGYGAMSSSPLTDPFLGDEGTDASDFGIGYSLLVGRNVGPVAVLGGLAWNNYDMQVGDTMAEGSARNVVGRVEFGRRRRIVAMAYLPFSGYSSTGARVDVPLFRNLNVTAQAWLRDGRADSPWLPNPMGVRMTTLLLGVRTGELR